MKVHHLSCGTMCPFGGRWVNGAGAPWTQARMVCHCLLIETEAGLVLIDSGLGLVDVREPARRLGPEFTAFVRPVLREEECAVRRVEALGFKAEDVRHIVLTHLDLDHAGGLSDFPWAKVHLHEPEHAAAMARAHWKEKRRYRPAQWAHKPDWATYAPKGERWYGFECARDLVGLPPEILIVPVAGHTRGHSAVAVKTESGWLLHAGDAYFHEGEMAAAPRCTPALRAFQAMMALDNAARLHNQARLRDLANRCAEEVTVFSAHDPKEYDRLAAG